MDNNTQPKNNEQKENNDSNPNGNSVLNKKPPSENVIGGDIPETTPPNGQNNPPGNPPDTESPDGWKRKHSAWNIWIQTLLVVFNLVMIGLFVVSMTCQNSATRSALNKTDSALIKTDCTNSITRRSLILSEKAFKMARVSDSTDSIMTIRDTLARDRNVKKELRAYVGIKEIANFSIGNNSISWKIQASNTGKTPAYNLTTYAIFKRDGTGVYKSDINRLFEDDDVSSSQMKGNGLDFTMNFNSRRTKIKIDSAYIAGVVSGKITIYFYGCITYDDIFGDSHKTWFCYYTEPVGGDTIRFQIYNKYNSGD